MSFYVLLFLEWQGYQGWNTFTTAVLAGTRIVRLDFMLKRNVSAYRYHQILEEEDDGLPFDLIQKMLTYEPSKRLLLVDALKIPRS